ncbi:hypothetical protein [Microbulbifer sp.]|uniref:hypothetical protein n=1 Tax=Microbulbifer sp. TaxID=1908541 RepID=UPI003F351C5F
MAAPPLLQQQEPQEDKTLGADRSRVQRVGELGFTWSICSVPAASDDTIVVPEIGDE